MDTEIVLTDLSDVLIRGIIGMDDILAEKYGFDVGRKFSARFAEMMPQFHSLMRGNMTEDEYWSMFLSVSEWNFIQIHEMKKLLSMNMQKKIPNTLELYSRMRLPNGSRPVFILVSDHIKERKNQMATFHKDVFSFMDDMCWSYDFGMIKSDKDFFTELLIAKSLTPRKIILIDDSLWNIENARKSHIRSFHFQNYHALERELRDLGFVFE